MKCAIICLGLPPGDFFFLPNLWALCISHSLMSIPSSAAMLATTRVFNLIANVNKQLIAYFGQIQLIAIL